jgi:hypothetical protein
MTTLSKSRSRPLTFRDAMHLKTAKCWLCLGDFSHADEEIRKIRRSACTHPEVVKVRYTFLRTLYGW